MRLWDEDRAQVGTVTITIRTGAAAMCSPRKSGLPIAHDRVELALYCEPVNPRRSIRPSELGIGGYDDLFQALEGQPVAGYVSWQLVGQLIDAIKHVEHIECPDWCVCQR